jgi:hypothetical protein
MKDSFNIGELAVLQHASHLHEYDGYLCIVLSSFEIRECLDLNSMEWEQAYICDVLILTHTNVPGSNRNIICARPHQIRKLRESDLQDEKNLKKYRAHKQLGGITIPLPDLETVQS